MNLKGYELLFFVMIASTGISNWYSYHSGWQQGRASVTKELKIQKTQNKHQQAPYGIPISS